MFDFYSKLKKKRLLIKDDLLVKNKLLFRDFLFDINNKKLDNKYKNYKFDFLIEKILNFLLVNYGYGSNLNSLNNKKILKSFFFEKIKIFLSNFYDNKIKSVDSKINRFDDKIIIENLDSFKENKSLKFDNEDDEIKNESNFFFVEFFTDNNQGIYSFRRQSLDTYVGKRQYIMYRAELKAYRDKRLLELGIGRDIREGRQIFLLKRRRLVFYSFFTSFFLKSKFGFFFQNYYSFVKKFFDIFLIFSFYFPILKFQ